ncbi:MarR family winged helix-turn-helix transcriptional regulator [Streptomyces sp. NPDC001858]
MGKSAGEQMGVATALVRSTFLVNAVYAESSRAYGITPQQGQLLCALMPQPYGMSELGEMLGLAKSSLTGLVDRTVQRGLVRREPDPRDGRAVRVGLTEDGDRLAHRFCDETCRRLEKLPSALHTNERDRLAALLARVVVDNKVPEVFTDPED